MKTSFLTDALVSCILATNCAISLANAALITESWQATVTSYNGSSYQVNDRITWDVTFDNESLILSDYLDGADEIPGTTDDTLSYVYDATCPNGYYCGDYIFMSEATFNFNGIYSNITSDLNDLGYTPHDRTSYNISGRYSSATVDEIIYNFGANAFYGWNSQPNSSGYFSVTATGNQRHRLEFSDMQIINIVNSVPEPDTLAIFALGILGLVSRKFKVDIIL